MLKNFAFLLFVCLWGVALTNAQTVRVTADDVSAHSQTTITSAILPVNLHAEVDAVGLQFDLYLPLGISFVSATKGAIAKASHVVTNSDKGGYTRIVIYSTGNETFGAREGTVLNVTVNIDTALTSKDYDVLLKNIVVSDASSPAVRYPVGDQHAAISVITLAERITLSDAFVEQSSGTYKQLSASVYPAYTTDKHISWKSLNDEVVSVDSTGLVTFVGKGITDVVATTVDGSNLSSSGHMYSDCSMVYADSMTAHSQSNVQTFVYPVKYQSNSDNTSVQFDLLLPAGFSVKSVAKGNVASSSHVVTKAAKSGYTRIVCYSPQNEVFAKRVGSLAEITIEVDTALASKDYDVLLKNIIVSDASSPAVRYSVGEQHAVISVTTLAERILLSQAFVEQESGTETLLTASIYPTYTTNKQISWKSLNNSVVRVDSTGQVTFIGKGITDVVATTCDGSGLSSVCHAFSDYPLLYADSIEAHSQSSVQTAVLPIRYRSNSNNSAVRFDLHMPQGLSVKSVQKGDVPSSSHVVTKAYKDGNIHIACYSPQNEAFVKQTGCLAEIAMEIDTALASNDYDIFIRNIMVSDVSDSSAWYSFGDQHTAVSITTLAERILLSDVFVEERSGTEKQFTASIYPAYTTNKQVFWQSLDDDVVKVDSMGLVTLVGKGLTDVVATALDGSGLSSVCHVYSDCSILYADSITAHSQSTVQTAVLPVNYQSSSDNSAVQFDLYLPRGISVKSVQKGDVPSSSHVVTKANKDGYNRFVCYSPQNKVFAKRKGCLAKITLEIDTALTSKDYDVLLKNIMVSDASSPAVRYSVGEQHAVISVTTLAESVTFNREYSVLSLNQEIQLTPIFYPAYTTNQEVQWYVDGNSIAKVGDGIVQAVGQGLGKVSATTLDGSNISSDHFVYVGSSMIYTDSQQLYSQSSKQVYEIPIKLNAFLDVSSFQTDLLLPEGIAFLSAENGDVASDSHIINVMTYAGTNRLLCYSSKNEDFLSRNGVVLNIRLQVDSALAKGIYNVSFTKTHVSTNGTPAIRYDVPDWQFSLDISTLAESIALNSNSLEILEGESAQLQAQILPLYVSDDKLSWLSQDPNIATVDNQGIVQGKCVGNTRIIVYATDGSNVSDTCTVRVNPVLAQRITLSQKNLYLDDKQNAQLECFLYPENVTYKKVDWISDDASIVIVDSTGYVHANKVGQTTIRVKTIDGTNLLDSCIVLVSPLQVTNIVLESDTIDIGIGFEQDINTIIEPQDATDKSLIWESSDNSVVTISESGRIKTMKEGYATITVTSVSNRAIKRDCVINVHPLTTRFSVKQSDDNTIILEWNALYYKDAVSDYNVYVSEDNEPFVLWLPNSTKQTATFKGQAGKSYRFLVTARDKAGKREAFNVNKCAIVTFTK